MRILLDLQACQSNGSRTRGIGRYSMSLAKAMVRHAGGHELWIAINESFPSTIDPIRQAFEGLLPKQNIKVFSVPRPASEHDPANVWRCRAAEMVREHFLAELRPDIVHVSSLFEGLTDDAVTSVGHLTHRFDTAVTLYDLIPFIRKETYLTNPQVRCWYFRKLQMLKNSELLLAISESAREEAMFSLQLPEARAVNISSAVDEMFQPQAMSSEALAAIKGRHGLVRSFIMYTGGIDRRKNIEGLIEGYALLPKDVRAAYHLAIVCTIQDTDRRRLKSLVSAFGLGDNDVVFTGFVPDEDLVQLYNTCALFVFPSLHEGFGLPALEAMSCGTAVIGSNASSIPEVIGRQDALFDPTDVHSIAAKIHQVLLDDGFRRSLREHGLEQAKLFSWDKSAKLALGAFEDLYARRRATSGKSQVAVGCPRRRPRLAYISPLPPEKSGIADYSAELLPELARYYDIEVVVQQPSVAEIWITANFPIRDTKWFEAHAGDYERVIYHIGNSEFHSHMFGLLKRHPGIVVLHDFFLSGVINFLDGKGDGSTVFSDALYYSHGYLPLTEEQVAGREAAVWKYPCNKSVLDDAAGVIVHSKHSIGLAKDWYGPQAAASWSYIPHLRAIPAATDRSTVRSQLGLTDSDFVVCSFGMLGPTKLNHRLLEAWVESGFSKDKNAFLIFVGENHPGAYGNALLSFITGSECSDQVKITGFASQELYRSYLTAADAAVQLRSRTRGETSGTILDCLAYGIPTVINAHGSAADFSREVTLRLEDEFLQEDLTDALLDLRKNSTLRKTLSEHSVSYIRSNHHPALIGAIYRDAIEKFYDDSAHSRYRCLISSIAKAATAIGPNQQDLLATAIAITSTHPAHLPCLLVDVSGLVEKTEEELAGDMAAGVLKALLAETGSGFRIEPIYATGGQYSYARRFCLSLIGVGLTLEDDPVDLKAGDIFLCLCPRPSTLKSIESQVSGLRIRGIPFLFVAADYLFSTTPSRTGVLPMQPCWESVAQAADGVIFITSRDINELMGWFQAERSKHTSREIDYHYVSCLPSATAQQMAPLILNGLHHLTDASPHSSMVTED